MIFRDNLRVQFYEAIRREHVVIVANSDVDALCATAILTHIFSCDDIPYSLRPVDSFSGLEAALDKNNGMQSKNIILLNCVGSNSLLEINVPENVKLWVLESRRPIHLDNIYNPDVIRVVAHGNEVEEWQIPEATAIYNEEQSDEEENEARDEDELDTEGEGRQSEEKEGDDDRSETGTHREEGQEQGPSGGSHSGPRGTGRRREDLAGIIEKRALRRQRRMQWKRNRGTLLWNYYMKSWFAAPTSLLMLELAHELGRSSAEIMWYTAIALSSQFIDHTVSAEHYNGLCLERMQPFIRKYKPKAGVSLDQIRRDDQLRISFDKELILPLYAHWNLYQSMANESTFICKSKLWSQRGEDKFKEILAQLGLSLMECNQKFMVMNRKRRREVFEILEKNIDSGFNSFFSHLGYSTSYSAVDFARILSLKLELTDIKTRYTRDQPNGEELCHRFEAANSILHSFLRANGCELGVLNQTVDEYKLALQSLNDLVKKSIVQGHVVSVSRYFIIAIGQQCPAIGLFASRHFLFHFAHSLLLAFAKEKKSRRNKPLVMTVPLGAENTGSWFLVAGIMPLTELIADSSRKSIIGSAFKHVAKEANIEIRHFFDSNVVIIRARDRTRFFNYLEARLETV